MLEMFVYFYLALLEYIISIQLTLNRVKSQTLKNNSILMIFKAVGFRNSLIFFIEIDFHLIQIGRLNKKMRAFLFSLSLTSRVCKWQKNLEMGCSNRPTNFFNNALSFNLRFLKMA